MIQGASCCRGALPAMLSSVVVDFVASPEAPAYAEAASLFPLPEIFLEASKLHLGDPKKCSKHLKTPHLAEFSHDTDHMAEISNKETNFWLWLKETQWCSMIQCLAIRTSKSGNGDLKFTCKHGIHRTSLSSCTFSSERKVEYVEFQWSQRKGLVSRG